MKTVYTELIETVAVVVLVIVLIGFALLCVKWGVPYQTIVIFSTLASILVGALTQKMKSGNTGPKD